MQGQLPSPAIKEHITTVRLEVLINDINKTHK